MPTPLLLIAHRGASRTAPENTLAAFRLAWQEGADGIEADFRLTRDGQLVCIHDPSTGRTAASDLVVAETSFQELRRLDVGSWKGAAWAGTRIPSLAEVLADLPAGKRFLIELKAGPEIIPPLKEIISQSGVDPGQLRILAFSASLITEVKRQLPKIRACWLSDYRLNKGGIWRPSRQQVLDTLLRIGAGGLASRSRSILDEQFVSALHAAGQELHVWTVDDVASARRLAALGVDSVMTNRPGWLRGMLNKAPAEQPDEAGAAGVPGSVPPGRDFR